MLNIWKSICQKHKIYLCWIYGKVSVGSKDISVLTIWKSICRRRKYMVWLYGVIIWYDLEKYLSEAEDIFDDYMVWLLVMEIVGRSEGWMPTVWTIRPFPLHPNWFQYHPYIWHIGRNKLCFNCSIFLDAEIFHNIFGFVNLSFIFQPFLWNFLLWTWSVDRKYRGRIVF